jgi:hypothetical protein
MPGRFPLTPVTVTGDPFCTDGFCGDPVAPEPPAFDPFAYEYVAPSIERWYGASEINNPTPTDGPRLPNSRYRTSEIQGFRVYPRFSIFPFVYVEPDGPQGLWAMTGNVTQIAGTTGQFNVLNIGVVYADGSGGEGNVPGIGWVVTNLQAPGIIIARIKTTFLFYDSTTGPVVASWPGYTFN